MFTKGPWHLTLFFVMLIAASLVMFVVAVGYDMGYHWERAGVLTLVAVAVFTLVTLGSRAPRWEPRVRPPPLGETPAGRSPASLTYLLFGATTVTMVLVGLAAVVVGPWVVSGGVVASYLAFPVARGSRAVGSAGEGSGGGTGPHAHPPSLLEQVAREGDMLGMALLWTAMLHFGIATMWFTFTQDDTAFAAGMGMSVLAWMLQIEAVVWMHAH